MLRSKTIQAALDAAAEALFEDTARVVWVGAPTRAGALSAPAPESVREMAPGAQGAVWSVEGDIRAGLATLRSCLPPGARLLLSVRLVPSTWRRLGGQLSGRTFHRRSRESVFEALLLTGLLEPRLWMDHPHHLCLSVELPKKLDPLDHVFTQSAEGIAR